VCSRSMRIDKWRDKWMKSYDVRVPTVPVDVLETHFRARARELDLEVLKPLAADLVAGKDGTTTSAGLSVIGAMVTVTTDVTKPDLDAELRRAASGAPKELFDLVASLGGAGAITRLVTKEGAELGRDIDMTLSRGGSVSDAAVAEAAKKIGLVAKSEAAFGSPQDPSPGSWYIGLIRDDKELTLMAANPRREESTACKNHPSREAPAVEAKPRTPEEEKRKKKEEDALLEEMMGP
jgi:hypothetical protein